MYLHIMADVRVPLNNLSVNVRAVLLNFMLQGISDFVTILGRGDISHKIQ